MVPFASFFHPSIHHLFKQNEQKYKQSKSIKNTYNTELDAKVHVGLLNRLHVENSVVYTETSGLGPSFSGSAISRVMQLIRYYWTRLLVVRLNYRLWTWTFNIFIELKIVGDLHSVKILQVRPTAWPVNTVQYSKGVFIATQLNSTELNRTQLCLPHLYSTPPLHLYTYSLLPVLGKVLKSFMADWLCDFLAPTLDPNQFGGLKQRSTAHALVSILHSWCSTLDQGGSVRAFFVDFTKAFDRVDHNILLTKLKHRGVPHCLVKWFHSYLRFRCQTVRVDNQYSDWVYVTAGMPQGSPRSTFIPVTNWWPHRRLSYP